MTGKFQEFFPRICYINLDHRTDRREETQAELIKAGVEANRWASQVINPSEESEMRRLSCKLAHLNIVREAKKQGLPRILILEDDVVFREDFIALAERSIADLQKVEWDLFYMGYDGYGYDHGKLHPVTPNLAKTESQYLMHCYAVNASGYDQFIRVMLDSSLGSTVDSVPVCNAHHFRVYCATPQLAYQRAGFSDADQRMCGRRG